MVMLLLKSMMVEILGRIAMAVSGGGKGGGGAACAARKSELLYLAAVVKYSRRVLCRVCGCRR